jgi:hypothetical protein
MGCIARHGGQCSELNSTRIPSAAKLDEQAIMKMVATANPYCFNRTIGPSLDDFQN